MMVLLFRFWTDPLGWSSWDETNWFGMFLLICLAILWLLVDLYRILRVRRMLRTIEKQNIARLKKIADTEIQTQRMVTEVQCTHQMKSLKLKRNQGHLSDKTTVAKGMVFQTENIKGLGIIAFNEVMAFSMPVFYLQA